MASTHDLVDIKAQMEERIAGLREAFGLVETDMQRFASDTEAFKVSALDDYQGDDNDLRQAADAIADTLSTDAQTVHDHGNKVEQDFQQLEDAVNNAKQTLDVHISTHNAMHIAFGGAFATMSQTADQVHGELQAAKDQHLHQVQDLAHTLHDLGDKVFGAAANVQKSVQEQQTEALTKAMQAFHDVIDGHTQNMLPGLFNEATQHLTQAAHDLGSHCTAAGETFQHEFETLIQDLQQHATHEMHDKVQEKFQKLMQEAVKYLEEQITESIALTTAGAGVTAAMSPLLPELAALHAATEAIKEAIKVFKALEDIF